MSKITGISSKLGQVKGDPLPEKSEGIMGNPTPGPIIIFRNRKPGSPLLIISIMLKFPPTASRTLFGAGEAEGYARWVPYRGEGPARAPPPIPSESQKIRLS